MSEDDVVKFISAAFNNNTEAIRRWLRAGGSPHIDFGDGRLSLMRLLASSGKTEALRALLDGGANPNERMPDRDTPLHSAAMGGQLAVVELLIARGADLNAVGEDNNTPLRVAVTMKHDAVAWRLCELGADPDRIGGDGYSDRMVAAYENVPLPPARKPPPAPPVAPVNPAGGANMSAATDFLKSQSSEEIEALWRTLSAAIMVRVQRGEISSERGEALQGMMREFDRARAVPDLEDRTEEMQRILARFVAIFTPERKT